mgnify:CR=1 FL=1
MDRWLVNIEYRTDNGPLAVEHEIEEIASLAELVERGPDWNTIDRMTIILNPARRTFTGTVEESRFR